MESKAIWIAVISVLLLATSPHYGLAAEKKIKKAASVSNANANTGIRIRCELEGATAYVDGTLKGSCNPKISIYVSPGKHKIIVKTEPNNEGIFQQFEKTIELGDGVGLEIDATEFKPQGTEEYYFNRWKIDGVNGLTKYLEYFPVGKYASISKATIVAGDTKAKMSDRRAAINTATGISWSDEAFGKVDAKETTTYIKYIINKKQHEGFSDWRLPTKAEFEHLLSFLKSAGWDGTRLDVYLSNIGYKNMLNDQGYISSTLSAKNKKDGYGLVMGSDNKIVEGELDGSCYIWPVRQ